MRQLLSFEARVGKLSKRDIETLNYARWPYKEFKLHEKSAEKLVKMGLTCRMFGDLLITDNGKRAQLIIEDSGRG